MNEELGHTSSPTPVARGGDQRSTFRWLWLPVVMVIVVVGVWITGGVITNDESVAKGLTGLWFAIAGVAVLVLAMRSRNAAVPAIAGYVIAAGGLGGFLLYSSTVDRVVDEDVVVAAPEVSATPNPAEDEQPEDVNTLLSKGQFVDGEHPTSGLASVIDTAKGTVVTLTSFETDPGPDLRVYFVPPGTDVGAGEDLEGRGVGDGLGEVLAEALGVAVGVAVGVGTGRGGVHVDGTVRHTSALSWAHRQASACRRRSRTRASAAPRSSTWMPSRRLSW